MPAWKTRNQWSAEYYEGYRQFVAWHAPLLRGRTEDCADLSMLLIVNFAEAEGLPLSFTDNNGVLYRSEASEPAPKLKTFDRSWSSKDSYYKTVTNRLDCRALFRYNTVRNPRGPAPGDLMLKDDHAALIFAVHRPGVEHPEAADPSIPVFPGRDKARLQLDQTRYFRSSESDPNVLHFDYLNHRGEGKQRAELIYYADNSVLDGGFQFRMYGPTVLSATPSGR